MRILQILWPNASFDAQFLSYFHCELAIYTSNFLFSRVGVFYALYVILGIAIWCIFRHSTFTFFPFQTTLIFSEIRH
jgi:hypothetical protein